MHLSTTGPFMMGESFGLADIRYMPYVDYLMQTKAADVISSRPKLAGRWKTASARPSWQKAIGKA